MAGEWQNFLDGIQTRFQTLEPDEVLFRAADEVRAIFHLKEGRMRLCRGVTVLHRVQAGALFAEESLFSPVYASDAVAETPCTVEAFPRALVMLHLAAHPQISLAFSAYLTRQVQTQHDQLEILRLKSAVERVEAYLTRKGAAGALIRLDQPLVAVADEIGLTHEALYRALAALTREGRLIRPGRGLFRLGQDL